MSHSEQCSAHIRVAQLVRETVLGKYSRLARSWTQQAVMACTASNWSSMLATTPCQCQVLKEQTRRYKHRVQEAERHAATVEQQLLAAQAANSKLKGQVLEGHAGQESEVVQLRQQAESLARALEVSPNQQCNSVDAACFA